MSANARVDETDAAAYVDEAMRGRLDDLAALHAVLDGDADQVEQRTLEGLGIGAEYDDHELRREPSGEEAETALGEYPLCVEATTTFHILLGTGGPDDRLLVECDTTTEGGREPRSPLDPGEPARTFYEVRRILYRYSWDGSAERVLHGEDYDTAERFARRVVPELAE